jgi:hypothetical protein
MAAVTKIGDKLLLDRATDQTEEATEYVAGWLVSATRGRLFMSANPIPWIISVFCGGTRDSRIRAYDGGKGRRAGGMMLVRSWAQSMLI